MDSYSTFALPSGNGFFPLRGERVGWLWSPPQVRMTNTSNLRMHGSSTPIAAGPVMIDERRAVATAGAPEYLRQ